MAFVRKKSSSAAPPSLRSDYATHAEVKLYTPEELLELARLRGIETAPLDVEALTELLGIDFLCVPMADEVSGSLTHQDERWVMKVNALHHPNRQRFTVAHELAHFARHRGYKTDFTDQNFFRNGDSTPMESEANKFAGDLLMPEAEFRKAVSLFGGKLEAISQHFRVSTLAVRVRAKTLGMKGHGL